MFREIVNRAKKLNAVPVIVVSHSTGTKNNPLTSAEKVSIIQAAFPGVDIRVSAPNKLIGTVVDELIKDYGGPGLMLLGSNRMEKNNMRFLNTKGITRNTAGGVRNKTISGTLARRAASNFNRNEFRRQFINPNMSNANMNALMRTIGNRVRNLPAVKPKTVKPRRKNAAAARGA